MGNNRPQNKAVVKEGDIDELEMLEWRIWWLLYEPTYIFETWLSGMLGDGPDKFSDFNDLKEEVLEALRKSPNIISVEYVDGTFKIETLVGPMS